jgi:hypothetical protein
VRWTLHAEGTAEGNANLYAARITLPSELPSGEYHVEIRAEDEAGGIYPFGESPLSLFPVRDLPVLDDDAIAGATFHTEGGALPPVFTTTGPILQGERSITFAVRPETSRGWHADLEFDGRLDFLGYSALSFALHPGTARGQTLTLELGEYHVRLVSRRSRRYIDLETDAWQRVEIPLDVFHRERSVAAIGFTGDLTGSFYVDDMRLVSERQVATQVTANEALPEEVELLQNYPNPFNARTSIPFRLSESARVELRVLDLLGQTVDILVNEVLTAGHHTIRWDATPASGQMLASGVYFYRLRVGDRALTRRLMLLR